MGVVERIWAPWRLEYVKDASKDNESECIFCAGIEEGTGATPRNLIVERGKALLRDPQQVSVHERPLMVTV